MTIPVPVLAPERRSDAFRASLFLGFCCEQGRETSRAEAAGDVHNFNFLVSLVDCYCYYYFTRFGQPILVLYADNNIEENIGR